MNQVAKEPIPTAEILVDESAYLGINEAQLAKKIGAPNNRIYQMINEECSIT